ncbi:UDP-GlcNAc:betaGal beta-1,3-N-acetylglucosaminyltransferase-like protein 1 isoform X4 [Mustela putorius furo]|uniref:UDP-GlcNAc:betaGal beta-1,3-N-acetylglucosaminyltransferase-like protein 1 isoform X4 n=1 Tax=Mustela putorius furo TaxID=9669 RepID=A0A8U0SER5_MUSPF|nr:UDP-GlcNAc:betaGal beta-1,3-N-acetylglucosaminyltransferase-like protein 1 isoform X4 [Mustela putorius furo]
MSTRSSSPCTTPSPGWTSACGPSCSRTSKAPWSSRSSTTPVRTGLRPSLRDGRGGWKTRGSPWSSEGTTLLHPEEDDVMMPQRVRLQLEAAAQHPTSIIGCRVRREPPKSTERYTRWINQLTPDQLLTQVFTSHGPTVIMPTWFCSRAWFFHVGPFDEGGQGVPEDLLFFYDHLRKGGGVVRVDQSLLLYRYLPDAATHSVLETTIWTHRVRFLEERVLPRWAAFTIWNAGRQGRRLYRSLTAEARRKVVAFCDVDENKIRKGFYCHEDSQERPKPRVPVLHFRAARPPFVICVKLVQGTGCSRPPWGPRSPCPSRAGPCGWVTAFTHSRVHPSSTGPGHFRPGNKDLTGGAFEDNLRSLHLREGQDFLHFS